MNVPLTILQVKVFLVLDDTYLLYLDGYITASKFSSQIL